VRQLGGQILQAVNRQVDPARFPDLSLTVIKLLGPGEYAVNGFVARQLFQRLRRGRAVRRVAALLTKPTGVSDEAAANQ